MANAFSAPLLRISSVEPLPCKICRCLRSANSRVTVSRDVLIICAISSWVNASFRRDSALVALPFFGAPFQQQFGQLLHSGVRQPEVANLVASRIVFSAQLLGDAEAG